MFRLLHELVGAGRREADIEVVEIRLSEFGGIGQLTVDPPAADRGKAIEDVAPGPGQIGVLRGRSRVVRPVGKERPRAGSDVLEFLQIGGGDVEDPQQGRQE